MTLEELQVEAKKLGYKLVKISEKKYIPLKPCPVCGKKSTSVWFGNFGMMRGQARRCNECDFEGIPGLNDTGSRQGWIIIGCGVTLIFFAFILALMIDN